MLLKAPLGRVIKLDTWGQTPLSTPPQNCDQDEKAAFVRSGTGSGELA